MPFAFKAQNADLAADAVHTSQADTAAYAEAAGYADTLDGAHLQGVLDSAHADAADTAATHAASGDHDQRYVNADGDGMTGLLTLTAGMSITQGGLNVAGALVAGSISGDLAAGIVQAGDVAAGAVDSASVRDGSLTGSDIANASISAPDIANATITGAQIAFGAIASAQLAAAYADGYAYDARFVNEAQAGSITGAMITDGTITSADVAPAFSVPFAINADMVDGAYAAALEESAEIDADIAAHAASAAHDGRYFTETESDARFVNEGQANSIVSPMIVDGTIITADVAAGFVAPSATNADMVDGVHAAVLEESADIAAVDADLNTHKTSADHDTRYVNEGQANSISSAMIADSTILSADIADSTILGTDIADSTILSIDIADSTIVSADIANATIAGADIAAGAVGSTQLATSYSNGSAYDSRFVNEGQASSITSAMITDGTIASADVASGFVAPSATDADTVDGVHAAALEESADITAVDTALTTHKTFSDHDSRYDGRYVRRDQDSTIRTLQDNEDSSYYLNLDATSKLYSLQIGPPEGETTLNTCGIRWGDKGGIYRENLTGWNADLCIVWPSGITIATESYQGLRFYEYGTEIFSVGNGDHHVRVASRLYCASMYDKDDVSYFVDPSSATRLSTLIVTGSKSFAQDHPTDPSKEIVYTCLEGPEAGTYIRGTAELHGGIATIELPETFGMLTSENGLTVSLTPLGKPMQLYVVEKTTARLIVREASGADGQFDYLIQGVRKGYENYQVVRDKPAPPQE